MPAVEIASTPLPAAPLSERIPLIGFLRRELAPFPGRAVGTLRIVIGCAVVLVLGMTLRVPETYLAVWVVTRIAMEESSQTLLTGVVMLDRADDRPRHPAGAAPRRHGSAGAALLSDGSDGSAGIVSQADVRDRRASAS